MTLGLKWLINEHTTSLPSVIVRSVIIRSTVGDSDCHQQFFSELRSPGHYHTRQTTEYSLVQTIYYEHTTIVYKSPYS